MEGGIRKVRKNSDIEERNAEDEDKTGQKDIKEPVSEYCVGNTDI